MLSAVKNIKKVEANQAIGVRGDVISRKTLNDSQNHEESRNHHPFGTTLEVQRTNHVPAYKI